MRDVVTERPFLEFNDEDIWIISSSLLN